MAATLKIIFFIILFSYFNPGPSNKCKSFESTPLTNKEKLDIVNRINERRNFVAMGRLPRFPQAANMNKIMWSKELANIAQRWADQCDHSVRPDREDQCRDIANMPVGQNIATVLGPSPGLNIKSMIDMWFMQNIFFNGTVTYFNQSSSSKTDYFTQLIWAETEFVGCGKAKFYLGSLRTVVMRIVCNFAPKGNRDGKPIYVIGLPSTQCRHGTLSNTRFRGLCHRQRIPATMFAVETSTVKSLLRILNLSNDSLKLELDPNNFKLINLNNSEDNFTRNKKTTQTYLRNRYGAIKRDSFHVDPPIQSDNYKDHQYTPERGHSRMYHGHQTRKESVYSYEPIKTFTEQNLRRNDFTTTPTMSYSDANYRRHYNMDRHNGCTGSLTVNDNGCCFTSNQCVTNVCTRGTNFQQHNCQINQNPCLTIPCPPKPCQQIIHSHQKSLCSCNGQLACSTPVSGCGQSPKCPYSSSTCATNPKSFCAFRRSEIEDINKSTQLNYYDLFPNLEIKSGDRKSSLDIHQKHRNDDYLISVGEKDYENNNYKQVKALHDMSKHKGLRDIQDTLHNYDSNLRERRDLQETTFKPFWQVEDFLYKKPPELKSMRYTTLSNRKRKNFFYNRGPSITSTEPITIQFKGDRHRVTEKYLSFEELMHLRKFDDEESQFYDDARRNEHSFLRQKQPAKTNPPKAAAKTTKAAAKTTQKPKTTAKPKATTTVKKTQATTKTTAKTTAKTTVKTTAKAATTEATTETTTDITTEATTEITAETTTDDYDYDEITVIITTNTPFKRLKYCTRKITCTWTASFITRKDGSTIRNNDNNGISRTPPGYVDGCTRTSTCTRDYMDRNKFDTSAPEDQETEDPERSGQHTDEDYCERRDLNKRRRHLVHKVTDEISQEPVSKPFTEISTLSKTSEHGVTIMGTKSSIPKNSNFNYKKSVGLKRFIRSYENIFNNYGCGKASYPAAQLIHRSTYTSSSKRRKISSKCPCNKAKSLKLISGCLIIAIQIILL